MSIKQDIQKYLRSFSPFTEWANGLVNKWEEEEHKERVARLRSTATIFPEIKKYPPMPNVEPPEVDTTVAQEPKLTHPVELIIEAMKERTETFSLTLENKPFNDIYDHAWVIVDNKTGFKFTLKVQSILRNLYYSTEPWMTPADCSAIIELIRKINNGLYLGDKEE